MTKGASKGDGRKRKLSDIDKLKESSSVVASFSSTSNSSRMKQISSMEMIANQDDDSEDEDDEILLVVELVDFKNHPIFDKVQKCTIEDIESETPKLRIGEYLLHGKLEETVGENYFYDIQNKDENNLYNFAGKTTKKIKFTISPSIE